MKKKVFFLWFAVLFAASNLSAQFTSDDVQFWVGEGVNSAILNIDFVVDGDSSSFVWGYHFDETTTGEQMLNAIAAADENLTVNIAGFLNDIYYIDYQGVAGDPTYWSTWSKTNDAAAWVTNMGIGTEVQNGEWFGCSYTLWDENFNPISAPGYPVAAEEIMVNFTQSDILFWVGEGANSAILNIDFVVDGDSSSFAWGYHFDGVTTGSQMLADVAAADEQLTVNAGVFLNDIFYEDYAGVAGNPTYWSTWSKTDDAASWATNMGISTEVQNGQWFGCSYTLYDEEFNPINEPGYPIAATNDNYVAGPYAPGADEIGTTAIPAVSDLFTAWASQCVVERGSIDISDDSAADASFGTATDATGIADGLTVVSLGDGGSAILTFDNPIGNGEGADFAVFENGFGDAFLELAFVEVSSDGVNYFRFPSSSLTQTEEQIGGFGELDPTYIHNLAGKYRANFGTPFDLEDLAGTAGLDINAITHVKIIDVVGSIDPQYGTLDSEGNLINDPFTTPFESGGFDLDAVGVINSTVSIQENSDLTWNFFPNPAHEIININTTVGGKLSIVDQTGKLCLFENIEFHSSTINISDLASGMYWMSLVTENKTMQKILVVE